MSVITLVHQEVVAAIREYVDKHYVQAPWLTAQIGEITILDDTDELDAVSASIVLLTPDSVQQEQA